MSAASVLSSYQWIAPISWPSLPKQVLTMPLFANESTRPTITSAQPLAAPKTPNKTAVKANATELPSQPTVLDVDDFATHLARMAEQWQPTLAKLPKPLNQLSTCAILPITLHYTAASLAFYYGSLPAIRNLWDWPKLNEQLRAQVKLSNAELQQQPAASYQQRQYQRHQMDWYRNALLLMASTGMGLSALCHAIASSSSGHQHLYPIANLSLSLAIPAQIIEACLSIQQFAELAISPMIPPHGAGPSMPRRAYQQLRLCAVMGLLTCPAIVFGAVTTSPWTNWLSTSLRSLGCMSLLTGVLSQPYFRGKLGWGV